MLMGWFGGGFGARMGGGFEMRISGGIDANAQLISYRASANFPSIRAAKDFHLVHVGP